MKGIDFVASILKQEGAEWMACFPANALIEAVAKQSIRPVIFRTERAGIHAADGYSRMMNGSKFGVFCMQRGPGTENAFGGVAQAWGDGVSVLILADSDVSMNHDLSVTFRAPMNYRHITKWADTVRHPERIGPMFRRAFNELRTGKPGPVLLELPRDAMAMEVPEDAAKYISPRAGAYLPARSDIRDAVKTLLGAQRPAIWAGQGLLNADASAELTEFAELTQIPVMTTMPGKSAFNERHPLSLGSTNATTTAPAWKWMQESDALFAIGTSMSGTHYGLRVPDGKVLIHSTISPANINQDHSIDIPLPGHARLVLEAMVEEAKAELGPEGRRGNTSVQEEIASVRQPWLEQWMPLLTSDEVPINPYRVIWDMEQTLDHDNTIVTHDAGHPRDEMMPFYTATVPHSYVGWGKTTHLGYGLGLMIGAKMAHPDRFCVAFMGDAAFGHCGLDIETAVRNGIPFTTVVINNSGMGGYKENMPTAYDLYGASALSGDYAGVARALGATGITVERPAEIVPALTEAQRVNSDGKVCLIEVKTSLENRMSNFSGSH